MSAQTQPPQGDLNRQVIGQAISTGLKMLASEEISTPNAWNKDLATLEQFLINMLTGKVTYGPAVAPAPPIPAKPFPGRDVGKGEGSDRGDPNEVPEEGEAA